MIKFLAKDYKLVKKEFDKGNKFWLIKRKPGKGNRIYEEVALIRWMKFHKKLKLRMNCATYNTKTGEMYWDEGYGETKIDDWNFKDYDFYAITNEEAGEYYKLIIMAKITRGKNG